MKVVLREITAICEKQALTSAPMALHASFHTIVKTNATGTKFRVGFSINKKKIHKLINIE